MVFMGQRNVKTYNGSLMEKGKENEDIIMKWLSSLGREVIDFREFKLAQRIDVDFGIETIDRNIVLAEIKSDRYISETGNLLFENHRVNHFVKDKWFYLGWGWRSPAQKLIIRNPGSSEVFVFDFAELRAFVGSWVAENGKQIRMSVVETDDQKTTFNYLIPFSQITFSYKKYLVNEALTDE